jgi:hypothetical protein
MVRFDARMLIVALQALLVSCGSGSHQPEPPAAVPAPAVQPQANPSAPSAPHPKADPKIAPRDSGGSGTYPWQSGPIAAAL